VELPPRRRLRCHPDQQRPGVRIRQRVAAPHRPGRPRAAHPDHRGVLCRPGRPARCRRAAARTAHVHRAARPHAPIMGTRLGPGR
jgi:hypothetical protein